MIQLSSDMTADIPVGERIDDLSVVAHRLLANDNIMIMTHDCPDGDTAGSAFALARGLTDIGKNVRVVCEKMESKNNPVVSVVERKFFSPDYVVAVDVPVRDKLYTNEIGVDSNVEVDLDIDHHASNSFFADETYLEDTSAATAEIIYELLCEMNIEITEDIAYCLYVGISTDTGCFRYSNTTSRTFLIASKLCETGIDIGEINKIQFETKTKPYVQLEKLVMQELKLYFGDKVAIAVIDQDMFRRTGTFGIDTAPLCQIPRQIDGVLVGITMKEKQSGDFRISIRSNEPVSAQNIAEILGGGGHRMSAGCHVTGTKAQALKIVLNAVQAELEQEDLL